MQFKCPSEVGTCISWDEKKAVNTKKKYFGSLVFSGKSVEGRKNKKNIH